MAYHGRAVYVYNLLCVHVKFNIRYIRHNPHWPSVAGIAIHIMGDLHLTVTFMSVYTGVYARLIRMTYTQDMICRGYSRDRDGVAVIVIIRHCHAWHYTACMALHSVAWHHYTRLHGITLPRRYCRLHSGLQHTKQVVSHPALTLISTNFTYLGASCKAPTLHLPAMGPGLSPLDAGCIRLGHGVSPAGRAARPPAVRGTRISRWHYLSGITSH